MGAKVGVRAIPLEKPCTNQAGEKGRLAMVGRLVASSASFRSPVNSFALMVDMGVPCHAGPFSLV